MAVKDTARFPGGWAYFGLLGWTGTAPPLPPRAVRPMSCRPRGAATTSFFSSIRSCGTLRPVLRHVRPRGKLSQSQLDNRFLASPTRACPRSPACRHPECREREIACARVPSVRLDTPGPARRPRRPSRFPPRPGPGHHRRHPRHRHRLLRQRALGGVVTLRNTETNAERTLTTNERGVYVAHAAPGRHLRRVGAGARLPRVPARPGWRSGWARRWSCSFALAPQVVQLQEITVAGRSRWWT